MSMMSAVPKNEPARTEGKPIRTLVDVYLVQMPCPIPGCHGEMCETGRVSGVGLPWHDHRCSVCNALAAFQGQRYPHREYVPKKKKKK